MPEPTATPRTEARAVDLGNPEWNRLWDEAVAGHIEGVAATVLIRSVIPQMAARSEAQGDVAARRCPKCGEAIE